MFKYTVDALNMDPTGTLTLAQIITIAPPALALGYGAIRVGASLCSELRVALFSNVAQRAIRTIADQLFANLHAQDLK